MELYTRVSDSAWEERPQGYRRAILKRTPTERIEIIELAPGGRMSAHFHPQKDETIFILDGCMQAFVDLRNYREGGGGRLGAGQSVYVPRGTVHAFHNHLRGSVRYLVHSRGIVDTASVWVTPTDELEHNRYPYSIYLTDDPIGQVEALRLMNQVPRWQKESGLSEPEQYLSRIDSARDNERIILLHCYDPYDGPFTFGAAFVGAVEGYDLEKTKAIVEYGKKDASVLNGKSIWINYQSWEDILGSARTALRPLELRKAWDTFIDACRDAFPDAEQVVVRSRHHNIWSYVYQEPWELVAEVDMRGFEWTAPDGKVFKGYDDKFSRYGILRLPLK